MYLFILLICYYKENKNRYRDKIFSDDPLIINSQFESTVQYHDLF